MPDNPANAMRFDVRIDGIDLGAFTGIDGLTVEYEVTQYQEGGENDFVHQLPGRVKYGNLKLTRPVDDRTNGISAWFHMLRRSNILRRQTATIVAMNDNSERVAVWTLADVYPVKYTGPSFGTDKAAVATETLELAHAGFLT
jgi:phage tail-like protein